MATGNSVVVLDGASAAAIGAAAGALGPPGDHGPSATVAMARVTRDATDLLVLGDSFIFYDTGSGTAVLTDDRMAALRLPEQRQYRERLAAGGGYDDARPPALAPTAACPSQSPSPPRPDAIGQLADVICGRCRRTYACHVDA